MAVDPQRPPPADAERAPVAFQGDDPLASGQLLGGHVDGKTVQGRHRQSVAFGADKAEQVRQPRPGEPGRLRPALVGQFDLVKAQALQHRAIELRGRLEAFLVIGQEGVEQRVGGAAVDGGDVAGDGEHHRPAWRRQVGRRAWPPGRPRQGQGQNENERQDMSHRRPPPLVCGVYRAVRA